MPMQVWRACNAQGQVLFQDQDHEKVRTFWSNRKDATSLAQVTVHRDEIALVELLDRVARGDKQIEADQQEDAEYFKHSTVLQGRVS